MSMLLFHGVVRDIESRMKRERQSENEVVEKKKIDTGLVVFFFFFFFFCCCFPVPYSVLSRFVISFLVRICFSRCKGREKEEEEGMEESG